jgi:hypothetical protein
MPGCSGARYVTGHGTAARAAAAIARIVDEPVPVAERARRILQVLGPVFRYDAASIALRDPERRIRIRLASAGDTAALHAYWSSADADAELARLGLTDPGHRCCRPSCPRPPPRRRTGAATSRRPASTAPSTPPCPPPTADTSAT